MGTWSKPLFATVSSGSPDDYVIDTSSMSERELDRWRSAAFLEDTSFTLTDLLEAAEKTRWTLTEFMDTHCDTHKIIDHMDREQIVRWEVLFRQLYTTYPTLERLAFHFFCSDGKFPYFLTMDREADAPLLLCQGHSESLKYFRPRQSSWFSCGPFGTTAEPESEFMVDWYRRGFQERTIDLQTIRLSSARVLW